MTAPFRAVTRRRVNSRSQQNPQGFLGAEVPGASPPQPNVTGTSVGERPTLVTPPNPTGPGQTTTPFGPANNLIGTQIGPGTSPRLQHLQEQGTAAGQRVGDFRLGRFRGINTPGPGQAQDLLNRGVDATQNAGLQPFANLGPLDFGAAQNFQGQAAQNVGQATVGPFGTIGATQDPRIAGLEAGAIGRTTGGAISDFQSVAPGTFAPAADTSAARAGISQQLANLQGGPSRGDLAARTFDLIQERGDPGFQRRLRDVGQRAAALGRVGAGVTTNELTDVFTQRERDLDQVRRGLALETAGQEIGDRFNNLQATQGVAGQLFGQDQAGAGIQAGLRDEARRDQGQRFQTELGQANLGLAQGGQLGNLAAGIAGRGAGLRAEERGERGFQAGLEGQNAALALQRAGQFAGLGDQAAQFAAAQRAAAGDDRAFQAGQGQAAADLALRQGGLFAGLGQQQFGQDQALRQEQRGERGAETQFNLADFNSRLAALQGLQGAEGQVFGQDQSLRNELRGERGFQTGLDQQAINNRIQQQLLQEQLLNGAFGRNFQQQQLFANLGFGGGFPNPGGFEFDAAQGLSNRAQQGAGQTGDLLMELLRQRERGRTEA